MLTQISDDSLSVQVTHHVIIFRDRQVIMVGQGGKGRPQRRLNI
jgi:hypothetical protein